MMRSASGSGVQRVSLVTALNVNSERLWSRHMEMARIGATPRGGVNRPALSAADAEARRLMVRWAKARGFRLTTDDIGNLFIRRPGRDDAASPVMTGSHLDSQPTGGRFDGTYGVLAGFEALETLEDAGITTRSPIEVVVWTNEEGTRFAPGMMGSGVFADRLALADLLTRRDVEGISVGDALKSFLAATPEIGKRRSAPPAAYIEAHIEQGPLLERAGKTIGVVTAIQGARWFQLELTGTEAHAGTTPLSARRDAMAAAIRILSRLQETIPDDADTVRFTVGRFHVFPGSPNTVPGRVVFTIDLRHPDAASLERLEAQIRRMAEREAPPCPVEVTRTLHAEPTLFAPSLVRNVRETARRLGFSHMDITSGALHDAAHLATICPTAMIFIPCMGGISHNEIEAATPEDVAAGAAVLTHVLTELAETF